MGKPNHGRKPPPPPRRTGKTTCCSMVAATMGRPARELAAGPPLRRLVGAVHRRPGDRMTWMLVLKLSVLMAVAGVIVESVVCAIIDRAKKGKP